MMSVQFTLREYQNWIQQSRRKRLLVEGMQDKRFFTNYIEILFDSNWKERLELDIDSADELTTTDNRVGLGNREKVEEICANITHTEYASRFVGFVDREFRKFSWNGMIVDELETHHIDGRLIWSRGHSIENYFFDFNTMRDPLSEHSLTIRYAEALGIFEACFESALKLASVISLLGYERNELSRIKASINWELIEINDSRVGLWLENWRANLIENRGFSSESAQEIVEGYWKWWEIIENTPNTVIRWICHGHVGFKLLWDIYARCVFEVCEDLDMKDRKTEASNTLNPKDVIRFNVCVGSWGRLVMQGSMNHPIEIIDLFGWQR